MCHIHLHFFFTGPPAERPIDTPTGGPSDRPILRTPEEASASSVKKRKVEAPKDGCPHCFELYVTPNPIEHFAVKHPTIVPPRGTSPCSICRGNHRLVSNGSKPHSSKFDCSRFQHHQHVQNNVSSSLQASQSVI